jgi:hypothetical protein
MSEHYPLATNLPEHLRPRPDDLLDISVSEGKYRVIQRAAGGCFALRYGCEWRDTVGDNLILSLAYTVQELREKKDE